MLLTNILMCIGSFVMIFLLSFPRKDLPFATHIAMFCFGMNILMLLMQIFLG